MKNTNEQIDKIIYEALSKEEAEFYDQLGEQNIIDMTLGVFKGKNKNLYILTFIMAFLLFGAVVYCSVQFYHADTLKEMLIYLGIALWCMMSVGFIKIWHWMQMNTNSVLREMKRLELQIAASNSQNK
ncbi:DUF6768 family protein [Fulvivirga lutimaris]|uniref:DUF6768 family protein n=1 Tax=Fulvivirga lutimaris TaxID=1819566 RepID=UPI0012BC0BA0|nr:DUF6768 family protein [Fulvivirga lutimaris]MTI40942.1 hypothetical protein [Fulvivirga lutimaris]